MRPSLEHISNEIGENSQMNLLIKESHSVARVRAHCWSAAILARYF